ncbi:MAG: phage tail protein [Oscillospiraceae bacterium]|nr:phage tail protein [Oscillospiraceae bacterium]
MSDFGLRIGLEGEASFKQSLRDINQAFKVLGSEMQLVTAQFDKNDKSMQAVTTRNGVLNREIDQQKEKITTLRAALENAASSFGENDRRTQNWQIQLNKAQTELIGMERELKSNNDLLAGYAKEQAAAGKASGEMGDGTKRAHASFADLGELLKGNVTKSVVDVKDGIVDTASRVVEGAREMGGSIVDFARDTITGENNVKALGDALRDKLEARLRGAGDEMEDTAEDAEDMGDEIEDAAKEADDAGGKFEKFGGVLKGIGTAMGAVALAAGAAAVKLGKEVVAAYADYEQLVGGVETLFGEAADTVQGYAANAFKTAGMSANEYMETVTGFSASLIQSLGGDTAKAAQVADMAITDMADNANKMGSDISSIQSAYQGFAKQNYTMLDNLKLGYGGTKTEMERLLADAEKFSGIKYDISSYADVAEAIHVIQTEMGITGTTAKEATETISGSIAGMQSSIGNLMAGLGDANADIGLLIGNVVEAFQNVVKNITPVIANIVKALPPALDGILKAVGDLLPDLLSTVTELFSQMLTTILTLLPELIPAAVEAVMTIVGALVENLPLLISTAVQLVTALVQGIAKALPDLIPAAVEAVTTIVQGLIDNLPLLLDAALQLVLGLTQGILDALPQLIAALPAIIDGIITFVLEAIPQIIEAGIALLTSLVEALPDIIAAIVEALPIIIDSIISGLLENLPLIIDAGIALLTAIIGALPDIIVTIVEALPEIIKGILGGLLGALPQLIEAGWQLLMGLLEGIFKAVPELLKGVGEVCKSLWNSVLEFFGIRSPSTLFADIGGNLVRGLWNGISDMTQWIKDKIFGFARGITDSIKSFFGIASPSKLFRDQIGANLAFGLGEGFEEAMHDVTRDMQDAVPTDFDHLRWGIDASLHSGIGSAGGGRGFSLTLNIGTFVNNSVQDLRQLADELSTIMAGEIRRKGILTT